MGAYRLAGPPHDIALSLSSRASATAQGRSAAPEWYDVTWNPTAGCSPAGPGCDHCPARRTVAQLARVGGKSGARYTGLTVTGRSGLEWTGEIRVRAELFAWPLLQHRPRRILVDSMSDLFHERLASETLDALHAVMAIAHWHQFLVLTRRAERMRDYYADPLAPKRIALESTRLMATVLPTLGLGANTGEEENGIAPAVARVRRAGIKQRWAAGLNRALRSSGIAAEGTPQRTGLNPWPLPNLWLGVSVEDQERISRIGHLMQVPAARRWACFEPLLGAVRPDAVAVDEGYVDALGGGHSRFGNNGHMAPLVEPSWRPLDWVVAGGEIGVGARPAQPQWVRELRDRCVAAGVPFFFKGWGEWEPQPDGGAERMVRVGRRGAGRLLDGRCWNETPAGLSRDRARRC